MRARNRVSVALIVAATTVGSGCFFPDDTTVAGSVGVVVSGVPDEMFLGDIATVSAVLNDSSGVPIPGTAFRFASSDPAALLVTEDSGSFTSATIQAVGPGTPSVSVEVVGIVGVTAEQVATFIHQALEVDSLTGFGSSDLDGDGDIGIAWGDTVFIWGVGLNRASLVTIDGIGSAPISGGYTPEDPSKPQARGRLAAWVVPPASSQSSVVVSSGLATAVFNGTLTVEQVDFLEPNDNEPAEVALGFNTPLIAMEPRQSVLDSVGVDTVLVDSDNDIGTPPDTILERRDSVVEIGGVDWYTMPVATTSDMSVVMNSPFGSDYPAGVFFVDTATFDIVAPGGMQYCGGLETTSVLFGDVPFGQLPRQFVFALQDAPVGGYEVLLDYGGLNLVEAIPYGYQVAASYISELAPDAAEENDLCGLAAPYETLGTTTFTIDNPGDPDWFAITTPSPAKFQAYTIRHPVGDGQDLDMYAFDMNASASSTQLIGWPLVGTQSEEIWAEMTSQDTYQFLVHDWAGEVTPYELAEVRTAPASAFNLTGVTDGTPDTLTLQDGRTTRVQSTLQDGGGYDEYAFFLNAGDSVDIDFDGTMTALQGLFGQAGEDISVLEKAERDVNLITPWAPFDCSFIDGFFQLYGPDSTLLAANDWDAFLAQVSVNFGPQRLSDPRIPLFVAPDTGVYTLRVYDYAGWACDTFGSCGNVATVNGIPQAFRFYMLEVRYNAADEAPSTPVARPQAVALDGFLRDPSLAQPAAPRQTMSAAALRQQYMNALPPEVRKKFDAGQLMQAPPAFMRERAVEAARQRDPSR
jgi:hypothetical protein